MVKPNILLVALVAFALGFCASEYRVAQRKAPVAPAVPVAQPASTTRELPVEQIATESAAQIPTLWESINHSFNAGRYSDAAAQLKVYLGDHKNSAEAWYLLARTFQKLNQPRDFVEAMFRFIALERDAQKVESALSELKRYLIALKASPSLLNEDYAWLMAQLDELAKYSNSSGEVHLVMAALALQLNDNYQAQYHALMAANDPVSQKAAEEILAKLDGNNNKLDETTIPLIRFGNQFLVKVSIEGFPAQLLIDTGASLSGLSSSYTAKYPFLVKAMKPIRLNTASGAHDSFLFTVDSITIANLNFTQHILAQLPMDSSVGFDGLLGVDILGRFDFVMDQNAAVLRLKSRKP